MIKNVTNIVFKKSNGELQGTRLNFFVALISCVSVFKERR